MGSKNSGKRGRKLLLLIGLAGLGAAILSQRKQAADPTGGWEPAAPAPAAPAPAPPPPPAPIPTSIGEPPASAAEPDTVADPLVDPIDEGAPAAEDSGSFFEQVMAETDPPARPRRTRKTTKSAAPKPAPKSTPKTTSKDTPAE